MVNLFGERHPNWTYWNRNNSDADSSIFSERELTFTFAVCYYIAHPSVCRLSAVCL